MATDPDVVPSSVLGKSDPQPSASILGLLKTVGPGLVYVLTIVGAGDIVTNSAAGAEYGYALLWALGLTLVFRFVWVNTSAKYVLVTGETLLQGYGRLGLWVIWVILFSLIVLRHVYNLYFIVLMGTTWNVLFPLNDTWSATFWSVFFMIAGYLIMAKGGYGILEMLCKILVAALGLSLIVVAALSKPDPVGIMEGLFIPSIPGDAGLYSAMLVLTAMIGTEAGSLTNLTYPYFMYEKGWRSLSFLKQQRFDLAFGVVCIFLMGALLQIAAAGTVKPMGIELQGPEHLVQIFSQRLGVIGLVVFSMGLWGAVFTTYVGATAGYALILTDICRKFIPRFKRPVPAANAQLPPEDTKRDPIYRWSVAFWAFSPAYILLTGASPIWLVLTVSALVVVLIPALAFSLLLLTNNRKLMGQYRNGVFTNVVMTLLILVSLYFTYYNVVDLFRRLTGTSG